MLWTTLRIHLSQTGHAHYRSLYGFYWIELVMYRGGGTSQVVYLINLHFEGVNDVMADQFEICFREKIAYIVLCTGKKIVHTHNLVALVQKPLAQVAAQKARTACHQDTHFIFFQQVNFRRGRL